MLLMEDVISPKVSWKITEEIFNSNYFALVTSDNRIYIAEEIGKAIDEKENIRYLITVDIQEKKDRQEEISANIFDVTSIDENDYGISTSIVFENSFKCVNGMDDLTSVWNREPRVDYLQATHKVIINAISFHEWVKVNPEWKKYKK